jgi:hypothetical protein
MSKATHYITVKFFENFPENYTKEMVWSAMVERFRKVLGDKLEQIIVEETSGNA